MVQDIDFGGLSVLFDNLGVGDKVDQLPSAVDMEQQDVRADNPTDPEPPLMDDLAVAEVAGDEIMVPAITETETPVVQDDKEKDSSAEQKTTRSGRQY